jgi:hypothetical protein
MKTLLFTLLVLLCPRILLSQDYSAVDTLFKFKSGINSQYKDLLYDYRLPDWGYSKALIEFETRGSGYHYNYEDGSNVSENYSYQLLPSYSRYYEGEKKICSQYVELNSGYSYARRKQRFSNINIITDKRNEFRLTFGNSMKRYLNDLLYVHLISDNYFQYDDSKYSYKYTYPDSAEHVESKNNSISRNYNTQLNMGIGLGRLRNITPIIRALRFNERLTLLSGINDLSKADIIALSELYTRSNGFASTYDRWQKYFYALLPDSIKNTIKNLSPWQFLYLSDVTQEIIGDRFEGFDANLGLILEYNKNIPEHGISNQEQFLLGLYLNDSYYHNPTLNYQIGVQLNGSFRKALNENTSTEYVGQVLFQVMNLWNVMDRTLLELHLGVESIFGQSNFKVDSPHKKWTRMDHYLAELSFNYFIENNLSVYSTAGISNRYNHPAVVLLYNRSDLYYDTNTKDVKSWNFWVGLRYYLDRRLH